MKKILHFLLATISIFIVHFSYAQVTLVADNSNLLSGFLLPNNTPVLIANNGAFYTTDGTTISLITTTVTSSDSGAAGIYKGKAFFSGRATADGDIELWTTDGTAGGTQLVKNISAASSSIPDNIFVFNNTLYFTADDGVHGRELWSSNGAVGNATMVTDINGNATSSFPDDAVFFINGNNVFFKATDATSTLGLYKLTASGVSLVKNDIGSDILLNAGLYSATIGNKIVFTVTKAGVPLGTSELWVSDGTAANTVVLKNFGPGSAAMIPQLVLFKNALYFDGYDLTGSGVELWSTDGTAANTKLFKDLNPSPGASSIPLLLASIVLNNKLYFNATTTDAGSELWSTDGTKNNTAMVKDINPGTGNSNPFFLFNAGALQTLIESGSTNNISLQKLYIPFNGKIYFTANDGTHGSELWSSDGTEANTNIVKDINSGSANAVDNANSSFFTTTGIYFSANDGTTGREPWVTDGSEGGTKPVDNINAGNANSNPTYLFIYNKQLYLTAKNGGSDTDLYKIDKELVILPVTLNNFMAAVQKSAVQLNWSTGGEVNTDRFGIERSKDGISFNEIASVAAKGVGGNGDNYQYMDESALHSGASTLYYRLKMIDKDARYSYSNVLRVTLQNNNSFSYSLGPNPAHNKLTVNFSGSDVTQATIRIVSNNGKPVYEKTLQTLPQASVQHNINVAGLASGVYFVQIIIGNETKMLKFIKQ